MQEEYIGNDLAENLIEMLTGKKPNKGRVKISIKHKYSMKNSFPDTEKEREKKQSSCCILWKK